MARHMAGAPLKAVKLLTAVGQLLNLTFPRAFLPKKSLPVIVTNINGQTLLPNTENTQLQDFRVSALTWAPQLVRGNRSVSVRDSADSEETTLALSQALLLPVDMKKEIESPPSKLLGSFMVNNINLTFVVSFLYPALLIAPIAILVTLHNFRPCKRWWSFPKNWTMQSPSMQG